MKNFAFLPAIRNQQLRRTARLLILSCILLLGTSLGFYWFNGPTSLAVTEPQHAEAVGRVVERWHGIVMLEDSTTGSYASCPWVCEGDSHSVRRQEWSLEVQDDGSVSGYIKTELLESSYQQSKTNINCGPVAETNYVLLNCTYAGQITQPHSTIVVQGIREIDEFSQQPVLRLTEQSETQDCEMQWMARGIHSETGATVHKQESNKCSGPLYVPRTYNILTYEDGRAPQISFDDSYGCCGSRSTIVGHLTATTDEPLLELDRELLERSVFLDQVSVEELFTANMNWNSPDGGWVTWKLSDGDAERVGPTDADQLPKPLNNGSQGVGRKQLTVQAQSTLKKTSQPEVTQVTVAPPPAWTGGPAQISATKVSGAVTYKSTFKFPEPPFEGTVTVPKIVPWLGSKKFGISETQGALSWEAQSTSEGQGSLSGQTGLTIMGKGLVGSLGGRARIVLGETGVKIPEGGMDFSIGGTIASEPESLLKVVPALNPALLAIEKISSQAANFIKKRAQAKLELQPKFDLSFNFFTENDEIKFKNAEAKPSFGFKTIVELKLIEDVLQAAASIGGTISATFQVPAPYFKEAALQGLVQAQITLYRWAWEGEKAWSVVVSGASAAIANAQQGAYNAGAGSWKPLDRFYLDMPNYARWHGDDVSEQADAQTGEDLLLVENVFPLTNPSLNLWNLTGGMKRVQVWAHDTESGGEIHLKQNYGSSWGGNPTVLTNDDQDDLAPQAVYFNNSQIMVLWQRMDTTSPPDFNDDPKGYLSHWQIAAQRVGGALQQLSTSGSLNYRHQLGATTDGPLAIWVNNPANQIIGDATNPDNILFAHFVANSWSVTGTVLSNVAGLLSLDLATNGQFGAIVYAQDLNGDLATVADQELFYLTWDGTTWSAPTQLTNNSVADENPELVLTADGSPRLVWRQDGVLKFLQGGWDGAPMNLPLAGAAERPDYDLVQGSDGHLALVWQEAGPEDTRIAYALFDATHNRWSGEHTVTPPEGAEGSMATNIAAVLLPADEDEEEDHGKIEFAYQLVHVETVTRTVDNVETETGIVNGVTMPNMVQMGQHDLRVATLPLRVNLSVSPADLSIPSADTIQAVIHNTGELAVENAPIVLHVGPADPVSGITQNITQTLPLLAAGSAATLTFSVADQGETIFVVGIDPARTLLESDTTDNRATLGTDIAITLWSAIYGPLGTTVRAQVTQNSNRYVSLLAPAILTLDSPDGVVVGGGQVGFPLAPTDGVTLTAFVSTTLLGAGRHQLYWTLDPAGSLGETDRSNNVAGTSIMILPDMAAANDTINFGTAPGNTAQVQMSVGNLGNWPNDATVVEVFDGLPGEAGSHSLLRVPLPTIEPGSTAEISGTLQLAGLPAATNGLSSIYIMLDPDGKIDESNENNNLVAAGAVLEGAAAEDGFPLYMPAIQR